MNGHTSTNLLANALLRMMAGSFNHRPSLKEEMRTNGSWFDLSVLKPTEANTVEQSITFRDGKARVASSVPADADVTMVYRDDSVIKRMLSLPPNEMLNLLLKSE